MTAKQNQIWFWEKEAEARFNAWKENIANGDKEGAQQAKNQYISAIQTLRELEEKYEFGVGR